LSKIQKVAPFIKNKIKLKNLEQFLKSKKKKIFSKKLIRKGLNLKNDISDSEYNITLLKNKAA